MKAIRLLALVAAAMLVVGGTAGATSEQPEPSRQPRTEGPIGFDGSQCSDEPVVSDEGTVLGHSEICLYQYSFETLSERDVLNEYGAAWIQGSFTPAQGWCVTDVEAGIEITGGRYSSTSKVATGKKASVRLALNAGGNALENAKISQPVSAAGGTFTTAAVKDANPGSAIEWRGKSAKAVAVVSGVGYSYPMLDGGPEKISYGFRHFAVASC